MKILSVGAALLVAGSVVVAYFGSTTPTGRPGMAEDEVSELLEAERQHADAVMLASILVGVGFLFVLLSFGTARGEGHAGARKLRKPPEST